VNCGASVERTQNIIQNLSQSSDPFLLFSVASFLLYISQKFIIMRFAASERNKLRHILKIELRFFGAF